MKKSRTVVKLILLVIALAVVIGFAINHNRRVNARAEADRIITLLPRAPDTEIRKAITSLLASKSWIRDITKQDFQRIVRLSDMCNEGRNEYKHHRRAWARRVANLIISGQHKAVEAQIIEVIANLQLITHGTQGMTEQDLERVKRLQGMCDKMRKLRNQADTVPDVPTPFEVPRKSS